MPAGSGLTATDETAQTEGASPVFSRQFPARPQQRRGGRLRMAPFCRFLRNGGTPLAAELRADPTDELGPPRAYSPSTVEARSLLDTRNRRPGV